MATAAQIRANRANARRSTGPRTARGKAVSSRNRLCHGLRSNSAHHLLEPRLSRIRAEFEGEHRPRGEAQRACVMTMSMYAARTYLIDALMEEAFRDPDPRKVAGRMMTLAQYALAAFGGFCNALRRLEKLKLASNVAEKTRASGGPGPACRRRTTRSSGRMRRHGGGHAGPVCARCRPRATIESNGRSP